MVFTADTRARRILCRSIWWRKWCETVSKPSNLLHACRAQKWVKCFHFRYFFLFFCRYLAATVFRPGGARQAFPCFDEPHLRAPFRISVFRDRFHIGLSNSIVHATDDVGFYMGTGLVSATLFLSHTFQFEEKINGGKKIVWQTKAKATGHTTNRKNATQRFFNVSLR